MNPIDSYAPSFWMATAFLLMFALAVATSYVRSKRSSGAHRAPRGQVANVHEYIHPGRHRMAVAA